MPLVLAVPCLPSLLSPHVYVSSPCWCSRWHLEIWNCLYLEGSVFKYVLKQGRRDQGRSSNQVFVARDNSYIPNRTVSQNAPEATLLCPNRTISQDTTEAIADVPSVCDPLGRPRRNFGKNTKHLPSKLSCLLEQGGEDRPLIRASTLQMSLCVQHIRVSFSLYPDHTVWHQRVEAWDQRDVFLFVWREPGCKAKDEKTLGPLAKARRLRSVTRSRSPFMPSLPSKDDSHSLRKYDCCSLRVKA